MVLGGLALLWAFVEWEQRRARRGEDAAARHRAADASRSCAPGSATLLGQQLVLMGTFFVIPVYLQVVLGLDAFETGKRLLPLSVAMLVFALLGPRIAARRSPRTVAQIGLVRRQRRRGRDARHARREAQRHRASRSRWRLIGAGAGLLASQLGQRDHVVRRAHADQRGRRPPGHGPEPRLLARHGDRRRRPARRRWRPASASASPTTRRSPRRARRPRSPNAPPRASTSCPCRPSSRRPWRPA